MFNTAEQQRIQQKESELLLDLALQAKERIGQDIQKIIETFNQAFPDDNPIKYSPQFSKTKTQFRYQKLLLASAVKRLEQITKRIQKIISEYDARFPNNPVKYPTQSPS